MTDFFILNNVIGVIDSGTGGINVIRECIKFYNEDFVYLVDNKNCPYGNKNPKLLKEILIKNINYLTQNFDLDFIIIACNTLSAIIDFGFMLNAKVPILKTNPSVKGIKNDGENVLIFATKNTLKNNRIIKLLKMNYSGIKMLYITGLPKDIDDYLVDYSQEKLLKINRKLKNAINNKNNNKIEYLALGCTHFKHIKNEIKNVVNKNVVFCECEQKVANNSKWLVRKYKKNNSIKVILSKEDYALADVICKHLQIKNCTHMHINIT